MRRALLSLLLAAGCTGPLASLTRSTPVATAAGQITVRADPLAAAEQARVEAALRQAAPRFSRWGALKAPVTLYLLPTHQALEQAVHRRGYGWLRAWARYDDIYLQTPGTWVGPQGGDADLDELLAHELTHCAMYQRAATPADWAQKQIPLWFREGMATWTAQQGARFVSLEELARDFDAHPHDDPILQAEALYRTRSDYVYSAAHLAFSFLEHRYREDRITRLLDAMAAGRSFPDAFEAAIGLSEARFVAEFRRFVRWRAFRGSGRSLH